jgi:hypothetical protein
VPAPPNPLRRHEGLERAAALLAAGADLDASLKQSGYRAARSSVVRMTSNIPVIELVAMFADRNCALVAEPAFADIGIHILDGGLIAVLAVPYDDRQYNPETRANP